MPPLVCRYAAAATPLYATLLVERRLGKRCFDFDAESGDDMRARASAEARRVRICLPPPRAAYTLRVTLMLLIRCHAPRRGSCAMR